MNDVFEAFAHLAGRIVARRWLQTCREEDAKSLSAEERRDTLPNEGDCRSTHLDLSESAWQEVKRQGPDPKP